MDNLQLTGYRRENGRVGVRNYVLIIPVDDISNAAAVGVISLIRGTMAIPHPYGRLQFGQDLELTFDTLIGTGRNPGRFCRHCRDRQTCRRLQHRAPG